MSEFGAGIVHLVMYLIRHRPPRRARQGLVAELWHPKVLDFGIARIQEFKPPADQDDPGRFVGTYEYASPEQIAGKNDELTPRSDVYAPGLSIHEPLTGRLSQRVGGRLQLDLGRIRVDEGPRAWLLGRESYGIS